MPKLLTSIKTFFDPGTIDVLKLALALKITLLLFVYFFHSLIPYNQNAPKVNYYYQPASLKLGELLSPWDGQWYRSIADKGYDDGEFQHFEKFMFFPLYPFIISILNLILPHTEINAIFISFFASILSVILLYKLTLSLTNSRDIAFLSSIIYLLLPSAIFSLSIYTESIFMVFTLLVFLFCEKRNFLLAGVFGFLAALTKIQGLLLLIPIFFEGTNYLKQSHFHYKKSIALLLSCILPLLGLVTFMVYASLVVHNPYATFIGSKHFQNLTPSMINAFKILGLQLINLPYLPLHNYLFSKIDTLLIFIYLILLIPMYRNFKKPSLLFFALAIVFFPLLSGKTTSAIRYVTLSFPHIIIIAHLINTRKTLKYTVLFFLATTSALFGLLYVNWYWVA